jgi:hypothetical protein
LEIWAPLKEKSTCAFGNNIMKSEMLLPDEKFEYLLIHAAEAETA